MMSVTSSVTPWMVSNSCSASSKRTWVIGGAGDRRQQGAAQRVAERVAEAGLERADGEPLAVALLLADRLDRRTLDDQHGCFLGIRCRSGAEGVGVGAGGRPGRRADYLE